MAEPCGTYAGAQTHKRAGERPCPACLDAQRRYMTDYRRRTGYRDAKARAAAMRELARLHPDEYRRLVGAHLARIEREGERRG